MKKRIFIILLLILLLLFGIYTSIIMFSFENTTDTQKIFQFISKNEDISDKDLRGFLYKNKGYINTIHDDGLNALMKCILSHDNRLSKLLIEYKIDLNYKDWKGNTSLHYAAIKNNTEIYTILVKKGANEKIPNREGKTPEQIFNKN
jgi:ankyrin repeat protein